MQDLVVVAQRVSSIVRAKIVFIIFGVSFLVNVFCWLGWKQLSSVYGLLGSFAVWSNFGCGCGIGLLLSIVRSCSVFFYVNLLRQMMVRSSCSSAILCLSYGVQFLCFFGVGLLVGGVHWMVVMM